MSERRQVSIFINGQQVDATVKNIRANFKQASNELARMVVGSEEYVKKLGEVKRLNTLLDEHRQKLKGVDDGLSLTRKGMDGLVGAAAGAFAADAVLTLGKELFRTGAQMEALNKKAQVVFGDTLPKITDEAKKNAAAMGLTTSEYIGAAAAIQDILVPMGFQREQAAEITTQLVNLSGVLSEWSGGQRSAQEVTEILTSALTGEREQLKGLGIVISQADVDARLAAQGMGKLEGSLRQQAEAAATLNLILEKSQDAQKAYAENADSMTRKSAELSVKFEEIKERVANALIPVFNGLIDVTNKYFDAANLLTELPEGFDAITGGLLPRLFATKEELQGINAELVKFAKFNALANDFLSNEKPQPNRFQFGQISDEQRANILKANAKFLEEQQKQEEAAAKKRAEAAKQRAEQLQNELQQLIQTKEQFRLDLQENIEKDELGRTLLAIDRRYEEQFKKARELEAAGVQEATAQRIALELLKQQEITAAVKEAVVKSEKEIAEKRAEEIEKSAQFLQQREEERAKAQKELDTFRNEGLLTDQQNEILQLEQHYMELLSVADDYGIDVTGLQEAYLKKKQEITDRYAKEEVEKQKELAEKLAEAQLEVQLATVSALSEGAQALAGFFDENSGAAKALFLFQKGLAVAELIINLQKEISGYAAANSLLGPAGIPITAAQVTAAKIRTGAGIATILATTIQEVAQKAEGGYLDVTGAQDNRRYRARAIDRPSTGLLPSYPVLFNSSATGQPVLASERGAEYFVSAEALRQPYIASLVDLIDQATSSTRVPQFADGGSTATVNAAAPSASGLEAAILAVLSKLSAQLDGGITAVIPDRTIVDVQKRFTKINAASDGLYG